MNMLLASSLRSIRGPHSIRRASALLAISPIQRTSPTQQQVRYKTGAAHTAWKMQKLAAGITYVVLPAGLIYPHPVLSYTLGISIPMYAYFCFHEIVTDYTNKKPLLNFVLNTAAIAFSSTTMIAISYFNFNDVGIAQALHSLLTL